MTTNVKIWSNSFSDLLVQRINNRLENISQSIGPILSNKSPIQMSTQPRLVSSNSQNSGENKTRNTQSFYEPIRLALPISPGPYQRVSDAQETHVVYVE